MAKIFSFDSQLHKVTGVEKVMLDIHRAIREEFESKIVGFIPFVNIRKEHSIKKEEYIKFCNPFIFYNSIVIVHERKLLILFWILNYLLFQRIKIVYVHHNIFHNHKYTTILPKTIIAIADEGIRNLVDYFGASPKCIHKIYNCVIDSRKTPHALMHKDCISLLLPGRINSQKQQIEIVRQLTGKLDSRIKICFVGDGPQLEELKKECIDKPQFDVLGFRNDVHELIRLHDFVLLYSVHEGLPITLIEATMLGTPIICSAVGGNPEICHNGKNGWVLNNWNDLIDTLNNLPNVSAAEYRKMCNESRRIYEEYFTYEIFKQKYLNLIKSL